MPDTRKILIFTHPMNFTYPLGSNSFPVVNGRALIPKKAWFDSFADNCEAMYGPDFKIEDYDADNPDHWLPQQNGTGSKSFGEDRQQVILHGPVTVNSLAAQKPFGKNPVISELDNQLAQALVTGTVDQLAADNPDALAGAGFIANTGTEAATITATPTKPKLGSK